MPAIGLSALITNPTRVFAFRGAVDRNALTRVAMLAFPAVLIGAWFFTTLSGSAAQLAIGVALLVLGPVGYLCRRNKFTISDRGLGLAAGAFGLLMGATSGSGIILLSILMARGLSGVSVIATDAAISSLLGLGKVGVFVAAGALPLQSWLIAMLIGVMALPGAMTGKKIAERLPGAAHLLLLEAAVMIGGIVMLAQPMSK